jgi:hypothetical protein
LQKNPAFGELEKFAAGFKKQLTEVVQINAEAQAAQQAVQQKIRSEGLLPGEAPMGEPPMGAPPIDQAPMQMSPTTDQLQGEAPALANVPT